MVQIFGVGALPPWEATTPHVPNSLWVYMVQILGVCPFTTWGDHHTPCAK